MIKAINTIKDLAILYSEKKKDGTLTAEEEAEIMRNAPALKEIFEIISDFRLLLGNKIFHDSEKLMEGLKKAGEGGDVEAQKAYEQVYKQWLEAGSEVRGG